jgi:hypothetical protein
MYLLQLCNIYVAPRIVATVWFVATSETKDMPHSEDMRPDRPLCDELSTGCRKWQDDEMRRKLNFCTSCPINHGWTTSRGTLFLRQSPKFLWGKYGNSRKAHVLTLRPGSSIAILVMTKNTHTHSLTTCHLPDRFAAHQRLSAQNDTLHWL